MLQLGVRMDRCAVGSGVRPDPGVAAASAAHQPSRGPLEDRPRADHGLFVVVYRDNATARDYRRGMKRACGILIAVSAAVAGCGDSPVNHGIERNGRLAACLERHGGERVRSAADLADVPMPRAMGASGAALASVAFSSIQFGVPGRRAQVRSIVVLDENIDDWPDQEFVRHVRAEPGRYATVILMPASRDDTDSVLWDCQEEVAPGEAFP